MLHSFKKYDLRNIQDTAKAASICYPFQLIKADLQTIDPLIVDSDGNEVPMKVSVKTVIRSDGLELGSVGPDYNLLQAPELAQHYQPYIDSGLVSLHSGGEAEQGRKIWMLGTVKGAEAEIVKNDSVKGNLLMATGFVGNLPYLSKLTNIRPVCANTLAMAIKDSSGHGYRVKHTSGMRERIEEVNIEMKRVLTDFQKSIEAYRSLAKKKISKQEFTVYVRHVLEAPKTEKETSTRQANIINKILENFERQADMEKVPAANGTMWSGYNAVTRYLTHDYGRNEDSRLNAQWFGESAKTSQRALDLALAYN